MIMENEYILIKEEPEKRGSAWNPKYFIYLSAFFSSVPVLICYIINFRRLNKNAILNRKTLCPVVGLLLLVISLFYIENVKYAKYIVYAFNIAIGFYMQYSQKDLFKEHIEEGGKSANYILPIIMSLAFTVLVIIMLLKYSVVPDHYKVYLDDEIYYSQGTNIKDVDLLAEFLIEIEYFEKDDLVTSVKCCEKNDAMHIYFAIIKEYVNDSECIQYFKDVEADLEEFFYVNRDVHIYLTDEYFKVLREIK